MPHRAPSHESRKARAARAREQHSFSSSTFEAPASRGYQPARFEEPTPYATAADAAAAAVAEHDAARAKPKKVKMRLSDMRGPKHAHADTSHAENLAAGTTPAHAAVERMRRSMDMQSWLTSSGDALSMVHRQRKLASPPPEPEPASKSTTMRKDKSRGLTAIPQGSARDVALPLAPLVSVTNFDALERAFSSAAPRGTSMRLEEFMGFLQQCGLGKMEYVYKRLFQAMDVDKDGNVSAKELVGALAMLSADATSADGTAVDLTRKLRFVYRMLDGDGKGGISSSEIRLFMKGFLVVEEDCIHIIFDSIDTLLGKNLGGAMTEQAVGELRSRVAAKMGAAFTERANEMGTRAFDTANRDHDAQISFEEFVAWVQKEPQLVRWVTGLGAYWASLASATEKYEGHFVPQMEAIPSGMASTSSKASDDGSGATKMPRRRLRRNSIGAAPDASNLATTYGATGAEGSHRKRSGSISRGRRPSMSRTGSAASRPHGHGGHAARAGRHRRNSLTMVGNISHGGLVASATGATVRRGSIDVRHLTAGEDMRQQIDAARLTHFLQTRCDFVGMKPLADLCNVQTSRFISLEELQAMLGQLKLGEAKALGAKGVRVLGEALHALLSNQQDGSVDRCLVACTLSHLCAAQATSKARLKFTFSVFDTNKDSMLQRAEVKAFFAMFEVPTLKIIDHALGHFYKTCGFEEELRGYISSQARSTLKNSFDRLLNQAFSSFDVNKDHKLEMHEFVAWSNANPSVGQWIARLARYLVGNLPLHCNIKDFEDNAAAGGE